MPKSFVDPPRSIDLAIVDRGFYCYDVYFGNHFLGSVKNQDADFVEAQAIQMFKAFLKKED